MHNFSALRKGRWVSRVTKYVSVHYLLGIEGNDEKLCYVINARPLRGDKKCTSEKGWGGGLKYPPDSQEIHLP